MSFQDSEKSNTSDKGPVVSAQPVANPVVRNSRAGDDPQSEPVTVMAWSNSDMLSWLNRSSYGRLAPVFLHHDIAGRHLPYINDAYLKEMGCDVVGERIALLEDLRQLQAESRRAWRKQVLFKQDEYRLGPCYGFLPFRCWFFPFCCDPCVPVAEKYMVSFQQ